MGRPGSAGECVRATMTGTKAYVRQLFATAVIAARAFMCLPHETAQQKRVRRGGRSHGTTRPAARGTRVRCRRGRVGSQRNAPSARWRSARRAHARQKGRVSASSLLGARWPTKADGALRAEARIEASTTDIGLRPRWGCTSYAATGKWRRSLRVNEARATAGHARTASGRTSLYFATLPSTFGARV